MQYHYLDCGDEREVIYMDHNYNSNLYSPKDIISTHCDDTNLITQIPQIPINTLEIPEYKSDNVLSKIKTKDIPYRSISDDDVVASYYGLIKEFQGCIVIH